MILMTSVVALGCNKPSPPPPQETPGAGDDWRTVDQSQLTPDQVAQRDRAVAARDELFTNLKGRLMEVISQEGPAQAILVCRQDAPELAKQVSQKHGLAIGRTSFRLRNPGNQPPSWAEPLVRDRVAEPTYLVSGERFAALLPIGMEAACLMCHGPKENLAADVKEALSGQYPEDQATGFALGGLRGWFWVEVPAPTAK
jgi:hypothetical protein